MNLTKPIAAVCHGVVLAARSGILSGKRCTALPWWMESLAYNLTRLWMGTYYKTYPDTSVEEEVTKACGEFVSKSQRIYIYIYYIYECIYIQ